MRLRLFPWIAVGCLAGVVVAGPKPARAPGHLMVVEDGRSGVEIGASLDARGIKVREIYDRAVLAELSETEAASMRDERMEVSDLRGRTKTGRGSWLFDTKGGEPALPASLRMDPSANPAYDTFIVQFIGPIHPRWIESLEDAGVEVFNYLPDYSFVVRTHPSKLNAIRRLPSVQWVGVYQPAYKISPAVSAPDLKDAPLIVLGFPNSHSDRAVSAISRSGGVVDSTWREGETFRILGKGNAETVASLARLSEVSWIDLVSPIHLMNDDATWVSQTNSQSVGRRVHNLGLTGEGQVVTVCDGNIDEATEALSGTGKFGAHLNPCAEECPTPVGGCGGSGSIHGTAVAGIIAGDAPDASNQRGTYNLQDGHAFNATLIEQNLGHSPEIPPAPMICRVYEPSFNAGGRIHTNGFGTNVGDCTNPIGYCIAAVDTDQFVWDKLHANPPGHFTITIGADNRGPTGGGDVSHIACEAQAKNVITVGGSKNGTLANEMVSDSSWGPACDGRLKPNIVAPGEDVCTATVSTASGGCSGDPAHNQYAPQGGTSFSHPAIAGNAALIREYFMDGWYPDGVQGGSTGFEPSAALIKAVMLNGAFRMTDASAYTPENPNTYPNVSRDGEGCTSTTRSSSTTARLTSGSCWRSMNTTHGADSPLPASSASTG